MPGYIYRCSRCRTRNSFHHPVDWYKIKRKCRDCGYQKFYKDKERRARQPCRCSGAYHWGAHRLGSPMCEHNPNYQANRALRDGTPLEDVAWGQLAGVSKHVEPPF